MAKVLIITSSLKLQLTLRLSLIYNRNQVLTCTTLEAAKGLIANEVFSSIILDIHHQDSCAFEFVKNLRHRGQFTPVMYVGERSYAEKIQKECSALDNALILPFDHTTFIRQLTHVERLSQLDDRPLRYSEIELNLKECKLTVKDRTIKVNRIEMKILLLLSNKVGKVVSLKKIYAMMEKESMRLNTRVFSHISNLREKLEAAGINTLNISFSVDGYRLDILH